jgi:hypothetical protein
MDDRLTYPCQAKPDEDEEGTPERARQRQQEDGELLRGGSEGASSVRTSG